MRSLAYFIREAFSNARKNFSTTFGGIITIFLSLLVVGIIMVASLIIDQMIKSVEDQVSITIYLSDNVYEDDRLEFQEYVRQMPEIKEVKYVSKEEALERFKEMSSAAIADALDGNPLPASFEIRLNNPENVQAVVDEIMSHRLFLIVIDKPETPNESIKYGREIIDRLFDVARTIRNVCLAFVLLEVFVALIFINNTIRLSVLARRKEIAIMKLVGASNSFIRGPFLMEGALQSIVGAGLAIGAVSALCNYLLVRMQMSIPWLPINVGQMDLWIIYTMLMGIGLLIGLFGSVFSMRRYLKV